MKKTGIACAAALALLAFACSSKPVRPAGPPPPPLAGKAGLLVGIWLRPVPAGIGGIRGLEGMHFRADGSYRLIGITSMTAVKWRVEGDDALILSTNTAKYPEPFESKLTIEELNATTLRLSASADYLAGTYHKEFELPRE